MAKKKAKAKFDDDIVSNQIIGKYGDIVEQGTKVLADLQNFNTIGISPALDLALGGGLREGSVVVMTGDPKPEKQLHHFTLRQKRKPQVKCILL